MYISKSIIKIIFSPNVIVHTNIIRIYRSSNFLVLYDFIMYFYTYKHITTKNNKENVTLIFVIG